MDSSKEGRSKAQRGYRVPYPLKVRTLADHLYCNSEIYATCESCGRTVLLDLPALIRQYGQDHPFDRIQHRLRCQSCGGMASVTIFGRKFEPRESSKPRSSRPRRSQNGRMPPKRRRRKTGWIEDLALGSLVLFGDFIICRLIRAAKIMVFIMIITLVIATLLAIYTNLFKVP